MGNYFGTDGIRGLASTVLTPEKVLWIGQAIARYALETSKSRECWIGIGKDTRLSGDIIEHSLIAGLLSMGVSVKSFGILPTPAIARLLDMQNCHLGVVISASHNPVEYNGLKIFANKGIKLSDEQEARIEYWIEKARLGLPLSKHPGRHFPLQDAPLTYAQSILQQYPHLRLDGLKIAIDCAHGATYWTSPHVLEQLGANVLPLCNTPDGSLINVNCGSTYPDFVEEASSQKAFPYDIAFSHDGDGDRVLARYQGKLVDGDHMMALTALSRQHETRLNSPTIVGTVMTNSGIEHFLMQTKIHLHRSAVGDRYVLEDMLRLKASMGGEQSGHLIYLDKGFTGDGLVSILETLQAILPNAFQKLDEVQEIPLLSQVLLNVKVSNKESVLQSKRFSGELEKIQNDYPQVRLVVRPSGTEPLFRILTEAPDPALAKQLAQHLADLAASL
jgi:phosphoglucosamine mutase